MHGLTIKMLLFTIIDFSSTGFMDYYIYVFNNVKLKVKSEFIPKWNILK